MSRGYFKTLRAANDWLSFDADEEELEAYAQAYPDQFEEWRMRCIFYLSLFG